MAPGVMSVPKEAAFTIECDGLGKLYRFYSNPRKRFLDTVFRRHHYQAFWALRQVSFSVARGESLGIIGENGAGKSTLLKILSGVLHPTEGKLNIFGKVTSILDLGAGFHPEFSGRENIFTYGMLVGYGRDQIREKIEEIIGFADIGPFIDRPVKIYSSGMFVRLAFSCATGFEPDVLVIDEVLAVGDQHFQRKCLDRIMGFREAGKTIVFCSHNMYQLREVCDRAIWIHGGKMAGYGEPRLVTEDYMDFQMTKSSTKGPSGSHENKLQEGCLGVLTKVEVCDHAGKPCSEFQTGDRMMVKMWTRFSPAVSWPAVGLGIKRAGDLQCYQITSQIDQIPMIPLGENRYYAEISFLNLELLSGHYFLSLATGDGQGMMAFDIWKDFFSFTVTHKTRELGICRLDHEWKIK
jgi:lipopolysaccharide transport system ATP-binding protein